MPALTTLNCPQCNNPISPGTKFCASCGHQLASADDAASDPLIGKTVGDRYRVEAKLGEGGMGAVYQALQVAMNRPVALKVLHSHLSADENLIERFHREAAASARLNHPNTITVHDFGQTDEGTLYIAMEFIEGKNLAEEVEEGGVMTWTRAVHVARQIADSLTDAHTMGIVHRDLKPDNVMLIDRAGKSDVVKILDFGIAKLAEASGEDSDKRKALTKTGMIFGTPQYMSPEQIRGSGVDNRTDIYALGVIIYQLVTGALPFHSDNPMGMLTKHLMEPPKPISIAFPGAGIPGELEALVMKCLEKDPDKRYQYMNEIVNELAALSDETRPGFAVGSTPAPVAGPSSALTTGPGVTPAPDTGSTPFAHGASTGGFANQPSTGGITPAPMVTDATAGGGGKGKTVFLAVVIILVLGGLGVGVALAYMAITGDDDPDPVASTPPVTPPTPVTPPVAPAIPPTTPAVPPATPPAVPQTPPTTPPPATAPAVKGARCSVVAGGKRPSKASKELAAALATREDQLSLCFAPLLKKGFDGGAKMTYRWGRGKGPNKLRTSKNTLGNDAVIVCLKTAVQMVTHPNAKRGGVAVLAISASGADGALKACKVSARVPVKSKGPKPPGWTPPAGYYPPGGYPGGYGGYGGY